MCPHSKSQRLECLCGSQDNYECLKCHKVWIEHKCKEPKLSHIFKATVEVPL